MQRLEQLRQSRDNDAVARSLDALRETARGQGNTMEPLLDCVRAYATVGEMCDALRDVWGEYEEVPLKSSSAVSREAGKSAVGRKTDSWSW